MLYYLSRKNLPESEKELLKAVAILPDYPVARLNLAALYHLEGNAEKSLDCLRKALAVSVANGEREQFLQRVRMTREQQEIEVPENFSLQAVQ